MVVEQLFAFIAGIFLLIKSADWLVFRASRIASTMGVSKFVIGFTLVAYATSLPELVVSLTSVFAHDPVIVTGTIVGSNIANIGLILGVVLILTSISVEKIYRKDMYILLAASILLSVFFMEGVVIFEGLILVFLVVYQAKLYKIRFKGTLPKIFKQFLHRKQPDEIVLESRGKTKTMAIDISILLISATLLGVGGSVVVSSTLELASIFNISEYFIALIAIAIGTSIPEIITSIMASIRKVSEVSIGNIIGSNIFNVSILGIASIFAAIPVTSTLFSIDIPAMLILTLMLLIMMEKKTRIGRPEGILLLATYAVFVYLQAVGM